MDFVEEYSRLQTPLYKKVTFAIAAFAVCGVVVLGIVATASSGGNANPVLLEASPWQDDGNPSQPIVVEEPKNRPKNRGKRPLINIIGQGLVRGTTLTSRKGKDYWAFYKIPYAQPPVGKLRFQPPQRPKMWATIRDASVPGPQCIQKEKYAPVRRAAGEEDCLFLNIYTPQLPQRGRGGNKPKLPVLFYLHGGGNTGNGTRYGAKYFMDESVVLVTIEFRMGVLSYFSTGSLNYRGNYGPKDQVMALQWVQKNIKRFGGDPDNVMIFGNSGGGMAVNSLLLSDMTKGLFHRAIMQSGNCIMNPGNATVAGLAQSVAQELGCDQNQGEKDLVACLRRVDAKDIVLTKTQETDAAFFVEPIPDNGDLSQTFCSDVPWNVMEQGKSHKVPVIVGDVNEESLSFNSWEYLIDDTRTQYLNEHWDEEFPRIMGIPDDANHTMARRFREVYFGDKEINNDTRFQLMQMSSDRFVHSQRLYALKHAEKTSENVYLYWITKPPARSYGEKYAEVFPPPYEVSHADELQYFFLYDGYPEITLDSPWFNYSEALVHMWATFAATGKPESPQKDWNPIDLADNGLKWYELGDHFGEIEPMSERMLLWDDYIEEIYVPKP